MTQPQEKRVRFAGDDIQYSYEVDFDCINDLWYSKQDFASFKFENHIIIRAVKEGASLDENEFCTRGLEKKIDEDWPQKNRYKTVQIVLSEQAMQKKLDYQDMHALREVSRMCTRWERQQALTLAALDAFSYEEQQPSPGARRRIVAVFDDEESTPTRYTPANIDSPDNNIENSQPELFSPRKVWQNDTWWKESNTAADKHKARPSVLRQNLANMVAARQARPPRNGGLGCLFCQAVPV